MRVSAKFSLIKCVIQRVFMPSALGLGSHDSLMTCVIQLVFLPSALACEEAWIRESHKRQMICEPTRATCKAMSTSSNRYIEKYISLKNIK